MSIAQLVKDVQGCESARHMANVSLLYFACQAAPSALLFDLQSIKCAVQLATAAALSSTSAYQTLAPPDAGDVSQESAAPSATDAKRTVRCTSSRAESSWHCQCGWPCCQPCPTRGHTLHVHAQDMQVSMLANDVRTCTCACTSWSENRSWMKQCASRCCCARV